MSLLRCTLFYCKARLGTWTLDIVYQARLKFCHERNLKTRKKWCHFLKFPLQLSKLLGLSTTFWTIWIIPYFFLGNEQKKKKQQHLRICFRHLKRKYSPTYFMSGNCLTLHLGNFTKSILSQIWTCTFRGLSVVCYFFTRRVEGVWKDLSRARSSSEITASWNVVYLPFTALFTDLCVVRWCFNNDSSHVWHFTNGDKK